MDNENISELLSNTGAQYIDKYGAISYLKYFFFIIGKKLAAGQITETVAAVACDRAEALATISINK